VAGLRAAVVGTSFGCRIHVPALRAAGFDVVALVGKDPERTARRADRVGVDRALTTVAAALDLGVDAVAIASPPATHAGLARQVIDAGRHLLVEKPFTLDTDEAVDLLERAEAARVVHVVGHEFRWAYSRSVAARALADGVIGEPRVATFVSWNGLVADPGLRMQDWWFDPAAGGGWLGASGSHIVDQIRTWLGEIASVSGTLRTVSARPAGMADDTFTVRLRMVSGCDVSFQQTAAAWGGFGAVTTVGGTDGTLWVDGDDVWVADRSGKRRLDVPEALRLPPTPAAVTDDPRLAFQHLELPPYIRLAEAFRDRIQGEERPDGVRPATFLDGVAAMQALDAIRESSRHNGAVVSLHLPLPPLGA
jgi:predicted dehydrogenase